MFLGSWRLKMRIPYCRFPDWKKGLSGVRGIKNERNFSSKCFVRELISLESRGYVRIRIASALQVTGLKVESRRTSAGVEGMCCSTFSILGISVNSVIKAKTGTLTISEQNTS